MCAPGPKCIWIQNEHTNERSIINTTKSQMSAAIPRKCITKIVSTKQETNITKEMAYQLELLEMCRQDAIHSTITTVHWITHNCFFNKNYVYLNA